MLCFTKKYGCGAIETRVVQTRCEHGAVCVLCMCALCVCVCVCVSVWGVCACGGWVGFVSFVCACM